MSKYDDIDNLNYSIKDILDNNFDELLKKMKQKLLSIEELKTTQYYQLKMINKIEMLQQENQQLKDIIKEVREYIEQPQHEMSVKTYQELLEILKENK